MSDEVQAWKPPPPPDVETTKKGKHPQSRLFTPQEIDEALLVIAQAGGNCKLASDMLKANEFRHVPAYETLRSWKNHLHAERYLELKEQYAPELERLAKSQFLETVLLSQQVQHLGLEKAYDQLEAGEAKDPAAVAQKAAVVGGISTDKLLTLSGRPNHIHESPDVNERLKALERSFPGLLAEEPVDAEVVDE